MAFDDETVPSPSFDLVLSLEFCQIWTMCLQKSPGFPLLGCIWGHAVTPAVGGSSLEQIEDAPDSFGSDGCAIIRSIPNLTSLHPVAAWILGRVIAESNFDEPEPSGLRPRGQ